MLLIQKELDIIAYAMQFIDPEGIYDSKEDIDAFYKLFARLHTES